MKNRLSKGYLTVEATISLTIFCFFMMFILNMGQIYRTQNYVNHGLLQTGKMLSFACYDYSHVSVTESIFDALCELFNFNSGTDLTLRADWEGERYDKAVERAFGYCADVNPQKTNETLKRYGLINGMSSINFTAAVSSGDLEISVDYQIQLPFAFFGFDHVTMHQQVKCGLWS